MNQRALEQAIRALALVLQAGNFGLVAFDAAEAPAGALKRLPFTTWLRLQRMLEGTQTVCVLVGPEPMARSSAGLTLQLGARLPNSGEPVAPKLDACPTSEGGARFSTRLFNGLDTVARVVRARARGCDDVRVCLSTAAC
jgi:hypothetical protein